uniref:Uncharacterized protein n=1 Tax=Oryza nivara TaxID=4536 RepID=A0A0E0HP17_ORYNI
MSSPSAAFLPSLLTGFRHSTPAVAWTEKLEEERKWGAGAAPWGRGWRHGARRRRPWRRRVREKAERRCARSGGGESGDARKHKEVRCWWGGPVEWEGEVGMGYGKLGFFLMGYWVVLGFYINSVSSVISVNRRR